MVCFTQGLRRLAGAAVVFGALAPFQPADAQTGPPTQAQPAPGAPATVAPAAPATVPPGGAASPLQLCIERFQALKNTRFAENFCTDTSRYGADNRVTTVEPYSQWRLPWSDLNREDRRMAVTPSPPPKGQL